MGGDPQTVQDGRPTYMDADIRNAMVESEGPHRFDG